MKKLIRCIGVALTALVTCVGTASAQTDVTSTYLTNADLEGNYTVAYEPRTDGSNARAIYQPNGWTVSWTNGNENDFSAMDSQCLQWSNFSERQQPTSGSKAYWIRYRWGSSVVIKLSQVVNNLPAGTYRFSADAFFPVGNGSSSAVISAAGQSVTVDTRNTWANYAVTFTLTAATNVEVAFTFTQTATAECIAGVDNFKLEKFDDNATADLQWSWTPMIANAGFERDCSGSGTGNSSGWLNNPFGFTLNCDAGWTDGSISSANPSEGNKCYNLWSNTFNSSNMYQDLILPTGKYTITADMRIDKMDFVSDQGVYATVGGTTYKSETITSVAGTWNSLDGWNTLTKSFYVTSDNSTVRIGLSSTGNGSSQTGWYQADNLTLTYNGAVSKAATAFSQDAATSVTANKWYAVTISVAGDYNLTASAATTFYYTNTAYQSPGDVTDSYSLTAGDNKKTLAAGTYYFRCSSAVTLTISPDNYSYVVGTATSNHNYVQGGETVTVTYANAETNNSNATFAKNGNPSITFNGTPVTITETMNGFSFTVPNGLTAATDNTLSIPANAFGYAAGSTYNDAQTITIKTPAVFNGTYFFKTDANKYLNRGSDWGTRAYVDDWGLPVEVATDAAGGSTLTFYDVTNRYIYNAETSVWTDATTKNEASTWYLSKLSNGKYRLQSAQQSGKYVKMDTNDSRIYSDGSDESLIVNWTLEAPSAHPAQMQDVKDAQAAAAATAAGISGVTTAAGLAQAVTSMSSTPVITPTPSNEITETAEEYQSQSGDIYAQQTVNVPAAGLYKFTIQGFSRMASNDRTYPIHTAGGDVPPVYAYFAGAKTLMASPFDLAAQSSYTTNCVEKGGYYYPDGQTSALKFFKDGEFVNTIWVYIDEAGDYTYGITNIGNTKENYQQWTCYTTQSISLTRYYTGSTDYVQDGVHYYQGSFDAVPNLEVTDAVPVIDLTGATYSGSANVTFTNPNGLVFANSGQVSNTKNVVIGTSCSNLELVDGHPFVNPTQFTATNAKYTLSAGASDGANDYFATVTVPFAWTPSGVTAYTLDQDLPVSSDVLKGTAATSVAANIPVLVKKGSSLNNQTFTASSATVPVVAANATFTNGKLVGTYTEQQAPAGSYVMQKHDSRLAFYRVPDSRPATVNPFRAWIAPQANGAKVLTIDFDDAPDATAIDGLLNNLGTIDADVYSVGGVRQQTLKKGVNIVRMSDGSVRKVIVK